jgi:tripartite-type tricarboxylate transporter receptor subunit TctC
MKTTLQVAICLPALLVSVMFSADTVTAQTYPNRAIQIVVPFPPGGSLDLTARIIGEKLSHGFGQPVIVGNRSGATGVIGSNFVARSVPDGYTLLMGTTGPITMLPALNEVMPYDSAKDFAPIIQVGAMYLLMVVPPSLPVRSLSEFIAYAKARPGKLNFVSSGVGTTGHLAGEMLKLMAGLDMVHVPHRGGAPAAVDLLGGQIELMFQLMPQMRPHVVAGQLRALGITSAKRSKALPDVPTMIEGGLADFEVVTWFGIFAPAGTPEPIVGRLNSEISKVLASSDVSARLAELGIEWAPNAPKEFSEFVQRDLKKWKLVVEKSGLPLQPAK